MILVAPDQVGVTCSRNRDVTIATLFLCSVLLLGDKQQMSRSLLNYEPWSYCCARVVCAQRDASIFVYRLPGHTQPLYFGFTEVKFDLACTWLFSAMNFEVSMTISEEWSSCSGDGGDPEIG